MKDSEEVQMVPAVAYESMVERSRRTIRYIVIGWAVSVVAMAAAIAYVLM